MCMQQNAKLIDEKVIQLLHYPIPSRSPTPTPDMQVPTIRIFIPIFICKTPSRWLVDVFAPTDLWSGSSSLLPGLSFCLHFSSHRPGVMLRFTLLHPHSRARPVPRCCLPQVFQRPIHLANPATRNICNTIQTVSRCSLHDSKVGLLRQRAW